MKAASLSPSMPLPQKRSRPRRTYQLDRSSTKSVMLAGGFGECDSWPDRRPRRLISVFRRLSTHLSISVSCALLQIVLGGIKLVDIGIEHIEAIGVPERAHELALALVTRRPWRSGWAATARWRRRNTSARRPRPACPARPRGLTTLPMMLAHLAAVLVLHMAQHQAVFEGRAVEHQRGDGQQGVEPAAGLVDGLGNEIGGEALLEHAPCFQRDSATAQRAWSRNRTSSR